MFGSELEELLVGHAAPQEIGKTRGKLEVVEIVGFDTEEEARRNENGFERQLHSLIDGLGLLNEGHQTGDFIVRHWPAVSAARQIGEISVGAGERVMAG